MPGSRLSALLMLALSGAAVFQSLVYLGLRTTTAVNAVLLNSSMPMFMLLCSWILLAMLFLGEAFAGFHAAGIAIILAGVLLATRLTSR